MRNSIVGAVVALAVVAAVPASADVKLFGAYQDTDSRDDTAGGGVSLGIPLAPVADIELRGSYLQKLEDDPLDGAFDNNEQVFTPGDIEIIPLDLGVRFNFTDNERGMNPYINGGASYFLLDSDRRGVNVDDEVGYFAGVGSNFGDDEGLSFFIEGVYRKVEATVESDPNALEDIDDLEGFHNNVDIDLDGFGANAGVRFGW
jgi:hypothetical protein